MENIRKKENKSNSITILMYTFQEFNEYIYIMLICLSYMCIKNIVSCL